MTKESCLQTRAPCPPARKENAGNTTKTDQNAIIKRGLHREKKKIQRPRFERKKKKQRGGAKSGGKDRAKRKKKDNGKSKGEGHEK